jgi:hypothetical protein
LTSKFKILKNKKGSWVDVFFICAIMFGIAIVILIGWKVMSDVNDEFQTKLTHSEARTIMQDNTGRYVNLFDGIFLFVFFGSFIAVIIGSLFLDTHPAFFAISLILLVIICFVVAVFANAYSELEVNPELSSFASDFTYIPFIMEHFVQIVIFMVCAISIALYSKSRTG